MKTSVFNAAVNRKNVCKYFPLLLRHYFICECYLSHCPHLTHLRRFSSFALNTIALLPGTSAFASVFRTFCEITNFPTFVCNVLSLSYTLVVIGFYILHWRSLWRKLPLAPFLCPLFFSVRIFMRVHPLCSLFKRHDDFFVHLQWKI